MRHLTPCALLLGAILCLGSCGSLGSRQSIHNAGLGGTRGAGVRTQVGTQIPWLRVHATEGKLVAGTIELFDDLNGDRIYQEEEPGKVLLRFEKGNPTSSLEMGSFLVPGSYGTPVVRARFTDTSGGTRECYWEGGMAYPNS